ncbi:MAG TPA: hypothetical protein VF928_05190, partial [Usitatibacteraceae bacterium]
RQDGKAWAVTAPCACHSQPMNRPAVQGTALVRPGVIADDRALNAFIDRHGKTEKQGRDPQRAQIGNQAETQHRHAVRQPARPQQCKPPTAIREYTRTVVGKGFDEVEGRPRAAMQAKGWRGAGVDGMARAWWGNARGVKIR